MIIDVIIPAFNEGESVPLVIADIPKDIVRRIIVVNNGSTDQTAQLAQNAGAIVLDEPKKGYGSACLRGISYSEIDPPDIVVFMDADFADDPKELPLLVEPILSKQYDFVLGSRLMGNREPGAMMPQSIVGNQIACFYLKMIYKADFTDLGPFRAIKWSTLKSLNMTDPNFGWTVEMQIKAVKNKVPFLEIPVSYRKRIGISKVTGTLAGTLGASYKILWLLFKYTFKN